MTRLSTTTSAASTVAAAAASSSRSRAYSFAEPRLAGLGVHLAVAGLAFGRRPGGVRGCHLADPSGLAAGPRVTVRGASAGARFDARQQVAISLHHAAQLLGVVLAVEEPVHRLAHQRARLAHRLPRLIDEPRLQLVESSLIVGGVLHFSLLARHPATSLLRASESRRVDSPTASSTIR